MAHITKKHLAIFVKICVAVACMIWVGKAQDWVKIKEIFINLNVFSFIICGGLFFLGQIIVALRWNYLLRIQAIRISNFKAIKLHLLGLFYNNFLPSSIGGDFLRAWYVTKHTHKRVEAAFSVFFDRGLGLVAMALLAGFGYFLVIYGKGFDLSSEQGSSDSFNISNYFKVIYVVLAVVAVVFIVVLATKRGRGLFKTVYSKLLAAFKRLANCLKIYAKSPFRALIALFMTFFSQTMTIIGMWILGKSLGIELDFKYYLAFLPITWVAGVVPVSIGGIGVVEGLLTGLFVMAGAEAEPAFALSLCQRAILLIVALPGIWIHLVGAHLPGEEFFVDSNETLV